MRSLFGFFTMTMLLIHVVGAVTGVKTSHLPVLGDAVEVPAVPQLEHYEACVVQNVHQDRLLCDNPQANNLVPERHLQNFQEYYRVEPVARGRLISQTTRKCRHSVTVWQNRQQHEVSTCS